MQPRKEKKMAIAIYPRVSTGSQAADGTSLDAHTGTLLKAGL